MNTGARQSTGDWLLLCHGDTLLPHNFPDAIWGAVKDSSAIGGAFSPRYQPASPWLKLIELLLRKPSPLLFFGESGLFFRRREFEVAGGFPDVPLMEELVLIRALKERGYLVRLPDQ